MHYYSASYLNNTLPLQNYITGSLACIGCDVGMRGMVKCLFQLIFRLNVTGSHGYLCFGLCESMLGPGIGVIL